MLVPRISRDADSHNDRPRPATNSMLTVRGALTIKFDRATWLFLKFDTRHAAYQQIRKYYRHDI